MLLLNAKLEFIAKTTKQAFTKKNIIVKKRRLISFQTLPL